MLNLFKKLAKPTVTVEASASARLAAAEAVLARDPDEAAALREKGEALFLLSRYCAKGRYDEATQCFERLSQRDPHDLQARYYRGLLNALGGRTDEAAAIARGLVEMSPRNGEEWYARAFACLFLKQREAAEDALERALALVPTHPRAINDRAGLEENPADAIAMLDRGLKARPDDPELLYNKACNFLWMENPKACVQTLEHLLAVAPLDAEAWILKGEALHAMEKARDAVAALQRGLELDKKSVKGWMLAGMALCDMGEAARAIPCFDHATELEPNDPDLWFNKGKACGMLRDFPRSVECFERALQVDPEHSDAREMLEACRRAGF